MQEAAAGEDGAAPGIQISELQRLRYIVDAISADTSVVPKGSVRMDASGKVVKHENFSGIAYPDKLESYVHGMVSSPCAVLRIIPQDNNSKPISAESELWCSWHIQLQCFSHAP